MGILSRKRTKRCSKKQRGNWMGGMFRVANTDCPICLVDFVAGDELTECGTCKNIFHGQCVRRWCVGKRNCPCPFCRSTIQAPTEPPAARRRATTPVVARRRRATPVVRRATRVLRSPPRRVTNDLIDVSTPRRTRRNNNAPRQPPQQQTSQYYNDMQGLLPYRTT